VLRALDKYDRLGVEGVRLLLGPGRKDESGDFTKGAGLDEKQVNRLVRFLAVQNTKALEDVTKTVVAGASVQGDVATFRPMIGEGSLSYFVESAKATFDTLRLNFGDNATAAEGIAELEAISALCVSAGYGPDRVLIDPSVVRGLEYYTGPVFEAELTFPVVNDEGQTVRFGSVAGGGRYDGLVGRFRPEPVPATGFSIGVSRLLSALQIVKSPIVAGRDVTGPVVVLVMDRDRIADYQRMVANLRGAGIRAELYLGSAGMKAQMKYADRRKAPCVVIQGSQEREAGLVQIKDLIEGIERAQADASAASNAEYRAARLAQVSVPEAELVEQVRGIIARHA
jgi:histidyl-tRNA synthetase